MKISKLSSLLLVAVLLITFGACKDESPAIKAANAINALSAKVEKVTSLEGLQDMSNDMTEIDKIFDENSDYVLTQDDKKALGDAIVNLSVAMEKKGSELMGRPTSEEYIEIAKKSIPQLLEMADTLGDLSHKKVTHDSSDTTSPDITTNDVEEEIEQTAASED